MYKYLSKMKSLAGIIVLTTSVLFILGCQATKIRTTAGKYTEGEYKLVWGRRFDKPKHRFCEVAVEKGLVRIGGSAMVPGR